MIRWRREPLEEHVRLLEDQLRSRSEPAGAVGDRQIALLASQLTAKDEPPSAFSAPALAAARKIRSNAPPYPRALKATVEQGIEAARPLFDAADRQEAGRSKIDTARLLRIRLARAEAEGRSGSYREAGVWAKQAADLNPTDPETVRRIARLLLDAGDYEAAEAALKRALADGKSTPDDMANCLGLLALLCWHGQRLEQAETLLKHALSLWETALGLEHHRTAACLDNLGALYAAQNRPADAEPLLRRAVRVWEATLSPEHPGTAISLYNLGKLYHAQGRLAEAEPLLIRTLNIQETALGSEHPDAAACLDNLGALRCAQSRFDEAEPLLRRSLDIREKTLGADHPETAISLANLAVLCCCQQQFEEAGSLLERALVVERRVFGKPHPTTQSTLEMLAALQTTEAEHAGAADLPLFGAARRRRKGRGS